MLGLTGRVRVRILEGSKALKSSFPDSLAVSPWEHSASHLMRVGSLPGTLCPSGPVPGVRSGPLRRRRRTVPSVGSAYAARCARLLPAGRLLRSFGARGVERTIVLAPALRTHARLALGRFGHRGDYRCTTAEGRRLSSPLGARCAAVCSGCWAFGASVRTSS